ncbi:MAG: carbon-nitrogen hydrolase [Bacteroidetes bacterium]|nr:carbon-nitrogen hydrolase [Bacteroidota bacterium]
MKAGFIQFAPILGEPETNRKKSIELLSRASEADVIVLPELANSGYNFKDKAQAYALSENISESPFIETLKEMAGINNQFIVTGINERDGGKLFNTSVLIGPEGILGKYRKVHLFLNEFDFFEKGNMGFPVFEINGFKLGMLICFDWIFPEAWRIMAMKGADLICHPSNLVLPYAQQAVPVHCMVNRIFAITANRYGTERKVTFSGRSFMSDPLGQTLCSAPENRDDVQILDLNLNLARQKMITPRNHALNDRRPDQYHFMNQSIDLPE